MMRYTLFLICLFFWQTVMGGVMEQNSLNDEGQALWIASPVQSPSQLFRKEFTLRKKVTKATMRASAQGLYELRINGQKVDDQLFTPGWTSYNHRLQVQEYDATPYIGKGRNAVGFIVGNGWYRSRMARIKGRWAYGDTLRVWAEMTIAYTDGTTDTITTDPTWRTASSPITMTDIYDGETFDARLWPDGWDMAGFNDIRWQPVTADTVKARLIPQEGVPVRVVKELKPLRRFTTPRGERVLDFGQNITGWVKFRLRGNAGDSIVLKFAETLDSDGNFYTANLRTAKATDTYIFRGNGMEEHSPRFTFFGFRYVKIEQYTGDINPQNFTAQVISSDLMPTGTFECSDTLINRFVENTRWSMTDNFLDIPTDCPQRDEKLGWTADAQVFAPTACYLADVRQFFVKWLRDLAIEQAPDGGVPCVVPDLRRSYGSSGWDDAVTELPTLLFKVYGDTLLLREFYPNMKRWVDYLCQHTDTTLVYHGGRFGDWFDYADADTAYHGPRTTKDLVGTAYFARSADLTARAAHVLGYDTEAQHYDSLAQQVKQVFRRRFLTAPASQTSLSLALAFGLLPEDEEPYYARLLADEVRRTGHITTGFLGTPLICPVLTKYGYEDEAALLLTRTDYPSWLYPVTRGATTIWERWDALRPDGTLSGHSLNHYAFGAAVGWLFSDVAGICQTDTSTGYRHILIRPRLTRHLHWACATYRSPAGLISSLWQRTPHGFTLTIEVPADATVILPEPDSQGRERIEVEAGRHTFICKNQ